MLRIVNRKIPALLPGSSSPYVPLASVGTESNRLARHSSLLCTMVLPANLGDTRLQNPHFQTQLLPVSSRGWGGGGRAIRTQLEVQPQVKALKSGYLGSESPS